MSVTVGGGVSWGPRPGGEVLIVPDFAPLLQPQGCEGSTKFGLSALCGLKRRMRSWYYNAVGGEKGALDGHSAEVSFVWLLCVGSMGWHSEDCCDHFTYLWWWW